MHIHPATSNDRDESQAPTPGSSGSKLTGDNNAVTLKSSNNSNIESQKAEKHLTRIQQCSRSKLLHGYVDTWLPEIGSWIVSFFFFILIIVILSVYNGQILPRFPYGITIGTLIALFSTLSTTLLMVPVSQGISQLKWLQFSYSDSRVADLEVFDQASRGALGSLMLIIHLKAQSVTLRDDFTSFRPKLIFQSRCLERSRVWVRL